MPQSSKFYSGIIRQSFVFLWLTLWVVSSYSLDQDKNSFDLQSGLLTTSEDFDIDELGSDISASDDFTINEYPNLFKVIDAGPPLASVIQQDGKIVIIRSVVFESASGFTDLDFGLVRFNPDGSLDQTFGTDGKTLVPSEAFFSGDELFSDNEFPTDITIQSDGKIIVVGSVDFVFGDQSFLIARFNIDGSLVRGAGVAFNQVGGFRGQDFATGIAIQKDGKIVVIGAIEVSNGGSENDVVRLFGVVRLDKDLNPDRSFGFGGQTITAFDRGNATSGSPKDVALQTDGKIIVVGSVELVNGDQDFGILRLNDSGSPDKSFGVDGRSLVAFNRGGNDIDTPTAVAVQADGKIIVVGSVGFGAGNQDFGVVRLNSDGSLDSSFGIGGGITIPFDLGGVNAAKPSDVSLQADGKIIVTGSVDLGEENQDYAVVRLNTNGSVDTSFGGRPFNISFDEGGSNADLATNVFFRQDGVIMLVGSVDNNDIIQSAGIVFLNSSGRLLEQVSRIPGLNLETKLSPPPSESEPEPELVLGPSPPNPEIPKNSQDEDPPTFVIPTTPNPFTDQYSGSWFDPSHNGEGFLIEILEDNLAVVYWFTYDNNGNQMWITGIGSVTDQGITVANAHITSGGMFGPDFDPMQVNRNPWGSLTFQFLDCDRGAVAYSGPAGFGIGRLNLQRLTSISGLVCGQTPRLENQSTGLERITGLWFDPSHNGEGYLLEILDNNRAVMFWFTYNNNGDQVWILGVGSVAGNTITVNNAEILSGGVFGPDFDPSSVIRQPWGSIIFTFSDCNTALVNYTGPPEFGMGTLNLMRLTSLANYRCTALP